ncbi:lipoprotein [Streptomyces gelaticus]|uniref:Lipoprotein n=1 Tax=Streptomyces gelaticus TaxID=285446 RepID=A0ABQ2W346_9ACTN|nr:copper chaperone PCu(A)C [Streptomyces gelaticus]GGV90306.1 lipoprotein [Streptomyces gelaticus]
MSRSLRHGALAATAIVFSIASLAACGAGNDAATLKVRPDSAATSIGDISIQNANVITQPELTAEGPAVVSATLFNSGTKPQTLEAVTLPGSSASVQLHAAKGAGPVVVPAGGSVVLGGKGNAAAVIENSREAAKAGNVQSVVFKFSSTGEVPLAAFVVPAKSYFTGFGPSTLPVAPQQSSEATPTNSASGKPAGAAGEPGNNEATPGDESSASAQSR